jgi:hypothetical protein
MDPAMKLASYPLKDAPRGCTLIPLNNECSQLDAYTE